MRPAGELRQQRSWQRSMSRTERYVLICIGTLPLMALALHFLYRLLDSSDWMLLGPIAAIALASLRKRQRRATAHSSQAAHIGPSHENRQPDVGTACAAPPKNKTADARSGGRARQSTASCRYGREKPGLTPDLTVREAGFCRDTGRYHRHARCFGGYSLHRQFVVRVLRVGPDDTNLQNLLFRVGGGLH